MKRIIAIITILMVATATCISNYSQVYCNEYNDIAPNDAVIQKIKDYANKDITKLITNIQVLAKNSLGAENGTSTNLEEKYKKEVNFYLSEVNYLLTNIRNDYDVYKNDDELANGFLALGMIGTDLRFALVQLRNYLNSETLEDQYKFLNAYFIIMNDANKNLNDMKSYFKKI